MTLNRPVFKIRYHRRYFKDIKKIPSHHEYKIKIFLKSLLSNPHIKHPNTKQLKLPVGHIFRARVGKFRVIYKINNKNKTIYLIGVGPRSGVYKIMDRLLDRN